MIPPALFKNKKDSNFPTTKTSKEENNQLPSSHENLTNKAFATHKRYDYPTAVPKANSPGFAHVDLLSKNAGAYAQSLFAQLHACDNAGSEIILVQAPPETAEWDGIGDRLKRASS